MQIKCDYCSNLIDDSLEKCPYCGAPSNSMSRAANGVPKTMEELKTFCTSRGIDLAKMRFHIGENYTGARAYGMYRDDDGNYVVYKNKSDGTRAVRYRGKDEDYAVNELYQKLKSEINEIKAHTAPGTRSGKPTAKPSPARSYTSMGSRPEVYYKKKKKITVGRVILAFFILLMLTSCIMAIFDDNPSGSSSNRYSGGSGSSGYYYSYDSDDDYDYDYDYDYGYSYDYDDDDGWDWSWDNDWDSDWDDDDDWDYDWGSDWDSDWDSDWGWDDDW